MKFKKKTLKNGLRIITVPTKDSPAVALYVMVEAGTKYEEKNQNGISHFLEHVCFKGTKRRPSAHAISSELDGIGAQSNAFTWYEFTGYHAKAHPKHLGKLVDILSDMYLNSTFPDKEIEKEKGVILEEINMYEDLPQRKAGMLFNTLLHGDQPAGWSILGEKKVISKITSDDFRMYRKKHYVASSTIVIVAGNFEEKKAITLIQKAFSSISTGQKSKKVKIIENQKAPKSLIFPKAVDQTHLVLGVRTFGAKDKRSTALLLLNTILGEGMSSRLSQKLREEMGVCYYVRSYIDEYTDHGDLSIASGVDTKRVIEVTKEILNELRILKTTQVSDAELIKAKEYLIGNLYLGLETSDALAGFYGTEEAIRGRLESPIELERKIRKVTSGDIKKIAQDIFKNSGLNLVIVGKVPERRAVSAVLKI